MHLNKTIPVKRNKPCPCGSGKKLKHCCINVVKEVRLAIEAGVSQDAIFTRQLFKQPLIQEGESDV